MPASLAAALSRLVEGESRAALRERARAISDNYRARRVTADAIRCADDALAYALARAPATYAAAAAALGRLAEENPDFAPKSLVDLGCGPGVAGIAAREVWPGLARATLVDRSREFLALARELADGDVVEADLTRLPPLEPADLVVAAYAFTELADADLPAFIDAAFAATAGVLVLIEPGTPRDHARLMAARARLLSQGGVVLAPCSHDAPCPLVAPDWCHFSVRLPRLRDHKLLKDGDAPFEDEKFSYLAVARAGGAPRPGFARIVARAKRQKHAICFTLCHNGGITRTSVAKRDTSAWRGLRKVDWGDRIAASPEEAP